MADRIRQKKASRLSVVISAVFHSILIGALAYFAAREGMLGKEMKKIAVTMVRKEKPPEKPKEKPPEPKPQEPEKPKEQEAAPPQRMAALPPPASAPAAAPSVSLPEAAPPAAEAPSFDFAGGTAVQTTSNPTEIYKNYMEYSFRSHWDRPENINDDNFVAEVAVNVAPDGTITGTDWQKGSGNTVWDSSVKKALAETTSIGRPPPKGFPSRIVVRFDVLTAADSASLQ